MHIATVFELSNRLIPVVTTLKDAIWAKAREWVDVVRWDVHMHLQDATPSTVGQEWSGYAIQHDDALALVRQSPHSLYLLTIGGTAVGTGINSTEFGEKVAVDIQDHRIPIYYCTKQIHFSVVPRRNSKGKIERSIVCIGSRINENCQ